MLHRWMLSVRDGQKNDTRPRKENKVNKAIERTANARKQRKNTKETHQRLESKSHTSKDIHQRKERQQTERG